MKIYLTIILSLLLAPVLLFAAYNDVTLTTDTIISVNGITLNVSGSSAVVESITVNSTNFTVTLQPSSTFTVTSSGRNRLLVDAPGAISISRPCTSTESSLTLSGASSGVTVTVSPSSSACDASETTTTTTTITGGVAPGTIVANVRPGTLVTEIEDGEIEDASAQEVAEPSSIVAIVSPVFNKTLRFGMTNDDVKRLQTLLATDPAIYPEGLTTGYFGSLTHRAVRNFQAKYGIVSTGNEESTGYGLVGPKTRAKIKEIFSQSLADSEDQIAQIEEMIKQLLEDVKKLQAELAAMLAE